MLHEEECRRATTRCGDAAPPRRTGNHSAYAAAAAVAFQCLLIAAKMRWQSKVGTTAHDFEMCRWLPILTPLHLHQRLYVVYIAAF